MKMISHIPTTTDVRDFRKNFNLHIIIKVSYNSFKFFSSNRLNKCNHKILSIINELNEEPLDTYFSTHPTTYYLLI